MHGETVTFNSNVLFKVNEW